jgi:hypothetical protein
VLESADPAQAWLAVKSMTLDEVLLMNLMFDARDDARARADAEAERRRREAARG